MTNEQMSRNFLKSLRYDTNYPNIRFLTEFIYWTSWLVILLLLLVSASTIHELSKDIYTHEMMVGMIVATVVGFAIWVLVFALFREFTHMLVDIADSAVKTSLMTERQSQDYQRSLEKWQTGQ